MDSETVDSCIQRILSSLYPPFHAADPTVLRQVCNVVDSCYRGDSLRFLLHFLIPAKHFLQSLQQDGCSRFSLCVQEKVLIQLCRLDHRCLLPSDFYLLLSPPAPAAPSCSASSSSARPCVVLCVFTSGRGGAEEHEVVELEPSSVFSMSWLEEVNGTRQRGGAARLKNCLLTSHDHIYRVPWEEVLTLAPSPWGEAHAKEGQESSSNQDGNTWTDGSGDQWRDNKGCRRRPQRSSGTAEEPKSPSLTLGGCFPMVPSVSRGDEGSSDSEGEYVDLCEITHTSKTRPAAARTTKAHPPNAHTTNTHTTSTHTSVPADGTHGDTQGDYIELCQLSPQKGSLTHSLLQRLRSHTKSSAGPTHAASDKCPNATTNDACADRSSSGVSQTALCSRLIEGLGDAPSPPTSCHAPLTSSHRPLLLTSPTPARPTMSATTSTSPGDSSASSLTQPAPGCSTARSTDDNIQTGTSSLEPPFHTNSSTENLHNGTSSSEHLHSDNILSEPVKPAGPTQQDQSGAQSSQCPPFPASDVARPLLTGIHQLNGSVLSSGAVCLPGTRDRMGRAVVTVCTRNAVWLNPGCNGTELLRILLYFFSTVRKEVRSLGLTILVDARVCPPDPALLKAVSMLQDNVPGSIHTVLMLTAKDQRLDTPSNIRVVMLSSVRSLYKHIDGSQLPVELSGSFSFCLSPWLDFRKRVEQLTNQCEDAVSLLQSNINSLNSPIPVTAQEAQVLLSSNRDLMRRILEDSRLVKLQLEGGASLSRLRKEESLSDDYRHAVQSVSGIYEQVDELVHHLVKTSNCRTQNLLFITEFSALEEGFKQVTVWIEDVGEVKLRGFSGEETGDVSLQELNKKQQDFTQFYNTACSMCQRGEALLKHLESLEVVPSADLQPCEDKVRSFCLRLQDFSRRVEETRQRLHKLLFLYRFFDKAYGWSLAAMRRLAGVTMEDCSQPEKCQAVIGCLESNRQQHPPIPDEEFEEMRLLAAEVGREAGLSQWHFAWSKCQEAKRTFERKLDTALRTQSDSAHRRLSDPTNGNQRGLDSVYGSQPRTDSTHSSQSSIDSTQSAQTAPDSIPGNQSFLDSAHSNHRGSDSINNNYRSPESTLSQRSDSTQGKQKTGDSTPSNQRSSDSTHSNQRSSESTPSNKRSSDSTPSNQRSPDDSIQGNHHSATDSAHGKQRSSGAWFCRRALSGVWGSRDRFSTTPSSSPPSTTSSPFMTHHFPRSVSSSGDSSPRSSAASSPTSTLTAPPSSTPSSCGPRRPLLRKTQSLDCPSTPDVPRYGGPCARGHVGVVIKGLEVTSTEVTDRPLTPRHAWPNGDRIRTDTLNAAVPPRAKGSKLGHIVDEMLCTEREYVRSLRYVVQHYYPEMERYDLPQDLRGKRSVIFGNLEKILDFHQQFFLRELEACHSHPLRVSHCFIRHMKQFGLYALYSKNKPKSDALLASHGNNFFKFKQAELGDKMDVASYLLKPIQRMSKYFLLLNELIKEVDQGQEAELTSLRSAAMMVQFQLRHGNDLLAMDAIRDCDVNLKEQGQLVRQDEFTVVCGRRKYQRHIFLFEELVLFSKPKRIEGGLDIYVYKHSFKTADVGLTESSGDSGLRFEVWFRRRTGRIRTTNQTYVLQASTSEIKHAWTTDIARILWNQATRNKELRTQELLSMGVGSKPFLDIKPSDAAINDRAIDYIMKGRGARTRASIAVSVFDHSNPFKRSAVNHVTSDPSTPEPSSSLLGPLNLHMYSQKLHPPQPDSSSCIEEDETSSQPSITTESSGSSSRCLSGSGSSGSDSGCVSAHLQEALCEEVGSPTCTSSPIDHKASTLSNHYMSAKAQIIGPATVV